MDDTPGGFVPSRGVRRTLRYRYVVISAVAAFAAWRAVLPPKVDDWLWFKTGGELVFGHHPSWASAPGGLHLYGNYPSFQIGPLALALAGVLRSRWAVVLVITALGPLAVWLLEQTARAACPEQSEKDRQMIVLVGGCVAMVAWAMLKGWVHLDDAMALALSCAALWSLVSGRSRSTGLLLALAVAAKPWAVVALPLVLVFRSRRRLEASTTFAAVSALVWLPFVLVDRHFFTAGKLEVHTSPMSVIHLFGVPVGGQPGWVRITQLVVGVAVAVVAVRRGRWQAVLVVGIAVRLLFDPGVFEYYSAGFVLAAFAWDLLSDRFPVVTIAGFGLLLLSARFVDTATVAGVLRLVATVGVVVLALGPGVPDLKTEKAPRPVGAEGRTA